MNAYEILASFAEALHCEYEAYNLPGALQDLEDRVINAGVNAVMHPHPATQQDTEIEPELEGPPSASKKGRGMRIADWTTRAACKGMNPDALFVQGAAQNRAKLICRGCAVRWECLGDALDNRIEFGVWGGLTERERRALLRRLPDVKSWSEFLMEARHAYERRQQEAAAGSA